MKDKQIYDVDLNNIVISELNVRRRNTTINIDGLAASIKKHGLLQPVVLSGEFGTPPYPLVVGRRRYLAHQELRRKTIPAIFWGEISRKTAILLSLVENLQSVELSRADTAKAMTELYEHYGKDERKLQRETGLSLHRIRGYLTAESQATEDMMQSMRRKQVGAADVKRAFRAAQGNVENAKKLLDLMSRSPLTRYQRKRVVEYGEKHANASAQEIIQEASRPRVEQTIMVSLPDSIRNALDQVTQNLSEEAEEIVTEVLREWLYEQGFMDE